MKKILIITSAVLVLLIGVVLSFALYSNSPFYKVKNNYAVSKMDDTIKPYVEDENITPTPESRDNSIVFESDGNSNPADEANDNSDGVPSRMETSRDAVQPENDIFSNSGDNDDSGNKSGRDMSNNERDNQRDNESDNDTDNSNNYGTDDNEDDEEHELEYNIELEVDRDAREIRVSSGTKTVCFRAETLIKTDKMLLIDAKTGSTVATMVDDGRRSINGDELMNDYVFSCKVDVDISKENIYEYYAVRNDKNKYDSVRSNTVGIDVYAGYTEKELSDGEEVFTAIDNLFDNDEFKSMDLDGKIDAMGKLLVELSENGTPEAPYSLVRKESIRYDNENFQYTFILQRGGIVIIPLVDINELHGHQ